MKSVRYLNGYRVIYKPEYKRAMESDNWNGYVYEHIYIAEKYLDRAIRDDEIVHHLDGNKSNNRVENLLVISESQHAKLHNWIDKGAPFEESGGEQGMNSGKPKSISTCEVCGVTLQKRQEKYCSTACYRAGSRKCQHPSKEELKTLLENNSREAVGRMFGVSGNSVKKWAIKYKLIRQS